MTVDTLNRVKYSGADFHTATDEILTRLQVNFATSYNDFAVSSLGVMLVDLFAFGFDTLSFFLDRRASDLYLSSARTRKSVARAARQLGYKMSPATASSVDINVAPETAQAFITPLSIGFQVQSPDGSVWEASQAYSWPIGNTDEQLITFAQAKTLTASFVSDGTANQVFTISNIPTDEFMVGPGADEVSQVVVTVDGDEWDEVELLTFGETNQFEIGYHDEPPTLRFGDSIAGNIPAGGVDVVITYRSSRGTLGSVTAGQTVTPVTALTVGFTTVNLVLSLPGGSSGGTNPESIEKAKANAPIYFKSRNVNITKEDYKVRAGSFTNSVYGAIAAAGAVTVRGASGDAQLQSLINDITSVSDEYVAEVASSATTIGGSFTGATTAVTASTTATASMATELTSIAAQAATLETSSQDALTASGLVSVFSSQIISNASLLDAAVSVVSTGVSDELTPATKTAISGFISSIQGAAINASSQANAVSSDLGTIAAAIGIVGSSSSNLSALQASLAAQLATASTDLLAADSAVDAMVAAIGDVENNVDDLAQQIVDHVDSFLSSDCQTNLVEVPVLTLDSDGFYVGPTIALMQALQSTLDSRKEITQVVKVVSGESLLIAASIEVHVGVLQGYVEATVKSQAEAAVLSVLKQREFGKNLKVSEVYWVLDPEQGTIDGISFVNVTFAGPTDKLDSNGNVVASDNEVVTRGTITVTSEIVTEA